MTLYMAVTADKVQLPLVVAETVAEIVAWTGRSKSAVLAEACRNTKRAATQPDRPLKGGRRFPYCIIRVEV